MAIRRNTTRAQENSDPTTVDHMELLPALREYRTSDLQPPAPRAHAQTMLSVAHDLADLEDAQMPACRRTLQ